MTIMCRNDELSSMMSWIGCLLKDAELFILFAENSQILLKILVITILLTFIYLVALVSKQPTQLIIAAHNCHTAYQIMFLWCDLIPIRLGIWMIIDKDQIISKGLFGILEFSQKWTSEFVFTIETNSFVRFLVEFEDIKKSFRNYLTFN